MVSPVMAHRYGREEAQEYTDLFTEGAISKKQSEAKQVLAAAPTRLDQPKKNVKKQA